MHSPKILFLMVCVGFYTHTMICSDHDEKSVLPRTDSEQKAYRHLTGEQLAGDSMYGPRTSTEITPKKKKPRPLLFLQSPISSGASAFPGQTPADSTVPAFPVAWSQDFDGDRKVRHGRSFFGTEVQSGRGSPEAQPDALVDSGSHSPVNAEQTEEFVVSSDAVRPGPSASSGQVAGYIESPKSSVDDSRMWDRQAQRGGVQDVPAKSCWTRFLMLCGCYQDAQK